MFDPACQIVLDLTNYGWVSVKCALNAVEKGHIQGKE
jgi:hypothetical protein